jgi:hypothetical protein
MDLASQLPENFTRVPAIAWFTENFSATFRDGVAPDDDSTIHLLSHISGLLSRQSEDQFRRRLSWLYGILGGWIGCQNPKYKSGFGQQLAAMW